MMQPELDYHTTPDTGAPSYLPTKKKGGLLPVGACTSADAPVNWSAAAPSTLPRATATLPVITLGNRIKFALIDTLINNGGKTEVLLPTRRGTVEKRGGGGTIGTTAEVAQECRRAVQQTHRALAQHQITRVVKRRARLINVFEPPLDRRYRNRHRAVARSLLIRHDAAERRL